MFAGAGVVAIVAAVWLLFFGTTAVEPTLIPSLPTSAIGSGEDAIGVAAVKPSTKELGWENPQAMVEIFGLQDGCRAFDRGPAMPYVERNFHGSAANCNP